MNAVLRATMIEMTADADPSRRWESCWIEVTEPGPVTILPRWKACLPRFQMMCDAVMSDIKNPEGIAWAMERIRQVESGAVDVADVGFNAWFINVTREKVWFEGQHDQGEGGEVTLSQFKLAVQTYLRFLSDPERKPVEVEFPEF